MRLAGALLLGLVAGLAALPAGVDGGAYAMPGNDTAGPRGPEPNMIVAATPPYISVFHPNATFAFKFGGEDLFGSTSSGDYVRGRTIDVAVSPLDGRIVAADSYDRIHVFYPNTTRALVFDGGFDEGHGNSYYDPLLTDLDVAVAPDGRIVVVERGWHRIHVFHPNGTLDFAFGLHGALPERFNGLSSVAVSPLDGRIVAADRDRI